MSTVTNNRMHNETFERHLRSWQVNQESIEYDQNEIDPKKKQLKERMGLSTKTAADWVVIRQLKKDISNIPAYEVPKEEDVVPSMRRRLASYLHLWMCRCENHSDDCGWLYDLTDTSPAHKYYLNVIDNLSNNGVNLDELLRCFEIYYSAASEAKLIIDNAIQTLYKAKES